MTAPDERADAIDHAGEATAPDPAAGFAGLGLRPEVLRALARLGYEEPTPIQAETIPLLVEGRDLLGQAATGTGKTAAFALPVLERIPADRARHQPLALVLVPTRELAIQVAEAVYRYGRDLGVEVLPVYGGQPIGHQLKVLRRGVDVVVATPGRAVDHIGRGTLPLDAVQVVVLDEADEMLDMGFAEDLEAILDATPTERQTVLFSATMPPRIDHLTRRHLRDPVRIRIAGPAADASATPLVRQRAHLVARAHKTAALARVLDVEAPTSALVFCRTRLEVDEVTEALKARGYRAEALHGGMDQPQRDRVMGRLRAGTADLLVATDVAARGLDVDSLTHVVNYDVPSAPESYVHRIGRVGRAGREGVAITLAEPREQRQLGNIERLTKQAITIEPVPSVEVLRARQQESTRTAIRERLDAGGLEQVRPVVDALADELELADIALAAIALLHEASGVVADEPHIPHVAPGKGKGKGGEARDRGRTGGRPEGRGAPAGPKSRGGRRSDDGASGETVTLWVSMGADEGVRPKDLVGAIANETRLNGRQIGPITITPGYSTVGVPSDAADEVIAAMTRSTIKGRRAKVRRDRHG